jgi:predicted transcriptional regulator
MPLPKYEKPSLRHEEHIMKVDPEMMFELADDLMKAQSELINKQNELITRLMDRIEKLEQTDTTTSSGLKGLSGAK